MTTYTIFAATTDGYVRSRNTTYATAAASGTLAADTTDTSLVIGQDFTTPNYDIYESFVQFTTSSVAGTINSAVLSLWGIINGSTSETVEARLFDWGTGLTTADWVTQTNLASNTLLASFATTSMSTSGYNDFTSDGAFISNINQAGSTRLLLNSLRHRNLTTPIATQYIVFASANTSGTTNDPKLVIDASAAYTLAANAGSFTLSGQAVGLNAGRRVAADAGSFSLSGQAVNLLAGRRISADLGTFTLAGQDVAFVHGYTMAAGAGAFVLTGQDVGLGKTAYVVQAEAGAFTLSGQDVGLPRGYVMPVDAGAFSLAGQNVGLLRSAKLTAGVGSFVLTGQAVTFFRGRVWALKFTAGRSNQVSIEGSDNTKSIRGRGNNRFIEGRP